MSTITYKCDVCKREIDKLENIEGLTVFSKCVITEGCKGKLYKIYRDASNIRESFPPIQEGVSDWFPRRLLYKHEQSVATKEWLVFHDLSTSPSVTVYEATSNGTVITDQDEYTVAVLDKDSISITFVNARKGIAHCIARSTVPVKPKVITPIANPIRVTANSSLVGAVPEIITTTYDSIGTPAPFNTRDHTIRIRIEVTRPNETPITCTEEFDGNINSTAWLGWPRILVRNRRHFNLVAKSILNLRAFSGIDDLAEIPNGTILRFLEIDYGDGYDEYGFREIPSRGLFLLLSTPPYESADKCRDRLIDVGEMVETEYDYFIFTDGELYTNGTNVENTYPDIKQAPGYTDVTPITVPPLETPPAPSASPPAPSAFVTPTPQATVTPLTSQAVTPTITPDVTVTPTEGATSTPQPTATTTPDVTATVTPDVTVTPTEGATSTPQPTATTTPDVTPTNTVTPNVTGTPEVTPTVTPNVTTTPTNTPPDGNPITSFTITEINDWVGVPTGGGTSSGTSTSNVVGGDAPYTFDWSYSEISGNTTVDETNGTSNVDYELTIGDLFTGVYSVGTIHCTITDNLGRSASASNNYSLEVDSGS